VTEFYNPVCSALDAYLAALGPGSCRFDFELIYLNSSGAKAVMMLMDKLDAAAAKGAAVDVYWFYDPRLRIRRLYPALEPEGWRPSRRT
jgi:hypothetical protein